MKRVQWVGGLAAVAVAGLMTGCMSAYRMSSTLEPSNVLVPSTGARFSIASVVFVNPTNVPSSDFPTFGDSQLESCYDYTTSEKAMPDGTMVMESTPVRHQRHRDVLSAAAVKLYPQMFTTEAGAIPLDVTITRIAATNEVPGNPCWSCLTLTVIPFRMTYKTDYAVQVKTQDADVNKVLELPVEFSRISSSSSSCIVPSSMLPVPGMKGVKRSGDEAQAYSGELTIQSCVEAVAKSVRRVEPGTWERVRSAR